MTLSIVVSVKLDMSYSIKIRPISVSSLIPAMSQTALCALVQIKISAPPAPPLILSPIVAKDAIKLYALISNTMIRAFKPVNAQIGLFYLTVNASIARRAIASLVTLQDVLFVTKDTMQTKENASAASIIAMNAHQEPAA